MQIEIVALGIHFYRNSKFSIILVKNKNRFNYTKFMSHFFIPEDGIMIPHKILRCGQFNNSVTYR